jgi:ribosomal protein S18 acetylase RimI-like enzyme
MSLASRLRVRDLDPSTDLSWAEAHLDEVFGGRLQARRGELVDVLALPGFIVETQNQRVGIATYDVRDECELAVLSAVNSGQGVGSALVGAVRERVGRRPIWVVTTNDNLDALRFYQRRGFRLRALRPGAVDEARRNLKPTIKESGDYGIPIRDEIELVLDEPR